MAIVKAPMAVAVAVAVAKGTLEKGPLGMAKEGTLSEAPSESPSEAPSEAPSQLI